MLLAQLQLILFTTTCWILTLLLFVGDYGQLLLDHYFIQYIYVPVGSLPTDDPVLQDWTCGPLPADPG